MNFTKSFEFSDHPFIVEKMIAQRFVIMLFVQFTFCYFAAISTWLKHICSFVQRFVIMLFVKFTFCYFAAISTWLKHTYVALCSVLLLCYLSNLLFVILQLYQHGLNTRMLLCAAFCYYAICRIYFLLLCSDCILTWFKHTYVAKL